jgi:nitronate monooxygenase
LKIPSDSVLPIGVGFITAKCIPADFIGNFIPVILEHRPAAVWLAFPPNRECHAEIIPALKTAGKAWRLKVFVQVGSVQTAREAVEDGADVVVAQGIDAGGHAWAKGAGLISLVPEVTDMLAEEFPNSHVQVIAAGGIMDGRGIAAALALGKSTVTLETALLTGEKEQMGL